MSSFLSSPLASTQLSAYLTRSPTAPRSYPQPEVYEELTEMAEWLVKQEAPHLAPDIAPEVVSEMWAVLEKHRQAGSTDFDPARGTARAFFRLLMRNALKSVVASYAAPGRPKRERASDAAEWAPPLAAASVEDLTDAQLVGSSSDMDEVEARLDAETLLGTVPPPVARVLYLAYAEGVPVGKAVRAAGMSRQQLNRAVHLLRAAA